MKVKIIYIFLLLPMLLWGQEERKYIREGVKAYKDGNYTEAEVGFRKAEEANNDSYVARYNTTAALYQQQNMEESGKRFTELMAEAPNDVEQAKLLHNLGNVMMNGQKYGEAVEAYKKSLRLNPADEDTRYNLAYALEKLREQQQQQQQNQDQQNKDQNQDQSNNDQDQQNKQDENQQQKENDQDQQQEQKQNSQDQEQQDLQEQQAQKQEMNKEEAERMLNAILQKEKDVKEKVDEQKAKATKIKTDKDW